VSHRHRRWILRLGLGLPIAAALGCVLGTLWLRRSLPDVSGQIAAAGIAESVAIVRDAEAIPHVFARSAGDAYFGLGVVHAQDRLWQLELTRRAGSGRLAEVFGPDALGEDRLMRTLGLRRSAERELPTLDAETRAALESYANGVNLGRAQARVLPPELLVLGVEPEAWTPVDSLLVLKLMGWQLTVQLGRELLRATLAERLSPQQITDLLGGDAPVATPELEPARFGALGPALRALGGGWLGPSHGAAALGSNAWAVSGQHTVSGKPLLANDPHLGLSMPGVWYLAHLDAPGASVIGATLPGVPGIILGRNDRVAWGFTNHRADALDLYLERVDPSDEKRYLVPGGSAPFEVAVERIEVRGEASVELAIRSSRHGPILSDVDEQARRALPPGHALALSYAGLLPDSGSARFPLAAARARSVDELLAAAEGLQSPPQNVISADVDGGLALIAAGRVPSRSAAAHPTSPLPGWLAESDWHGYLPPGELPRTLRPATGRLVSANQDPAPAGYPHWLGADFADPVRAERIEHELMQTDRHDVASFAALQVDQHSQRAAELVARLLPRLPSEPPASPELAEAVRRLSAWDAVLRRDAAEPLLFAEWLRELTRAVFQDELGDRFADVSFEAGERLTRLLCDGATTWCDDVSTPAPESCDGLARAALERALETLRAHHGADLSSWRWGDAHPAHFRHLPFGGVPLIGGWFDTQVASGGGNDTVNLAEYVETDPDQPFAAEYGPSYRAIYDLGDPEASSFIAAVGQSGNPLSPYYRHWAERWQRGERVPMLTDRSKLEATALGTLRLDPSH
jgi:penicillin G amidase